MEEKKRVDREKGRHSLTDREIIIEITENRRIIGRYTQLHNILYTIKLLLRSTADD